MAKKRRKAKALKRPRSSIGQRLRAVIEARGQSIVDFAKKAGVPHRTLYHYLSGPTEPSAAHLARISAAGVDLHWLLTGQAPLARSVHHLMTENVDSSRVEDQRFFADSDLTTFVSQEALRLASEFHERHVKRGGKMLPVGELNRVAGHYIGAISKLISGVGEDFIRLLKDGTAKDELMKLVTASLGAKWDEEVVRLCKSPAWE